MGNKSIQWANNWKNIAKRIYCIKGVQFFSTYPAIFFIQVLSEVRCIKNYSKKHALFKKTMSLRVAKILFYTYHLLHPTVLFKATLRIANFFRLLAHSILFSIKLFCWKMNPNSENISELLKWGLRFKNCLMFYQYIQRIRKAKSWIGYKSWRELSNTSIAWNWS